MATKRMLVDAIHPEETRVVVTAGNRLDEFDFESASRRQLRGNIYLAKVTRVEPSLQAAFIEYGGNRHGFLAFSEIHPDYYQIPVADREALLRDEEQEDRAEAEAEPAESISIPADAEDTDAEADPQDPSHVEDAHSDDVVESVGGGDALEEVPERRRQPRRNYKIQEVIKRRQVMLVQVVKEERGNKGAALTTYLSLAGRYSVLMPNTARGGGISRKITNAADRKRLKEITADLEVPQGMGVILRTAGASRTKAEVKRDFEYLMRLWENVRSLTLKSIAPCLVYEEGSLIKRTIRDLYNKDIDEVLVAGDAAYREAKDFMRMIMPSHAKNVQQYREDQPIFSKFAVEAQLDSMFSPQVTLPSGGYIVINPTEALVSIDVNSGRSTKEHNIEDTALQTNLEASEEIARQLRLRDLAGLIVIDFIDMMENRSNRAVERKLKDCLKDDRARIQVGRISHFGLMEMSRQRIRFGVVEGSTHSCPTCQGTGLVRSVESVALMVMRAVEDHVLRKPEQSIAVRMPTDVALYVLNVKRGQLNDLEAKYRLTITVSADDKLVGSHYAIERGEDRAIPIARTQGEPVRVDSAQIDDLVEEDEIEEDAVEVVAEEAETTPAAAGDADRTRSRRRRRRRGERNDEPAARRSDAVPPPQAREQDAVDDEDEDADGESDGEEISAAGGQPPRDGEEPRRRRRRGRRGGRRNRRPDELGDQPTTNGDVAAEGNGEVVAETTAPIEDNAGLTDQVGAAVLAQDAIAEAADIIPEVAPEPVAEKPKRSRSRRKTAEPAEAAPVVAEAAPEPVVDARPAADSDAPSPAKPRRSRRKAADPTPEQVAESAAKLTAATTGEEKAEPAPAPQTIAPAEAVAEAPRRRRKEIPDGEIVVSSTAPVEPVADEKPKKVGWWQRRLGLG